MDEQRRKKKKSYSNSGYIQIVDALVVEKRMSRETASKLKQLKQTDELRYNYFLKKVNLKDNVQRQRH